KMGKVEVEVRGDPFAFSLPQDKVSDYARKIASTKIYEVGQKVLPGQGTLYGEIEYEKRRISGETKAFGILYDGFHLQGVFCGIIPREELSLKCVHIFFTNRLLATWDDSNQRYHLRTSVYGIPSIVSTTGLIEAPAKPREYYLLKQQYERLGRDLTELKDRFRGGFIDYEDKRLAEVAKGYAMKAVFCALTGDPFCGNKVCRLYNAHRQEEVIGAQLGGDYQLCPHHQGLLDEMRRGEAA
ncbi:MAG: hypothetical protein QGF81_05110, partial [Dehalococcoidia bacterium]|nr:hypothetical protein [Dehalococcoidia bacterium]